MEISMICHLFKSEYIILREIRYLFTLNKYSDTRLLAPIESTFITLQFRKMLLVISRSLLHI